MHHEPLTTGRTFNTLMACIFEQTQDAAHREEEAARQQLEEAHQVEREAEREAERRHAAEIERRLEEEAARQERFARARVELKRRGERLELEHDAARQARLEAERVHSLERRLRQAEAARMSAEADAAAAIARVRTMTTQPVVPTPPRRRPSAPPVAAARPGIAAWLVAAAMTVVFVASGLGLSALTFQGAAPEAYTIHTKVTYSPVALGESTEGEFVAAPQARPERRRSSWRKRARARIARSAAAQPAAAEVVAVDPAPERARSFNTLDVGANPFSAERF